MTDEGRDSEEGSVVELVAGDKGLLPPPTILPGLTPPREPEPVLLFELRGSLGDNGAVRIVAVVVGLSSTAIEEEEVIAEELDAVSEFI